MTNENKIKRNITKRTTTIVGVLLIGLVMLSSVMAIPNVNAQNRSPQNPPIPPNVVGCYYYSVQTGWKTIPCATENQLHDIRQHHPGAPPIAKKEVPTEGNVYGVYGLHAQGTTVNFGKTDVKFSAYGGEQDSGGTTNGWSIQTNTNKWTVGNTGYWDQFVYQNNPNNSNLNRICIWQVVNNTNYNNLHCPGTEPGAQTLTSSYEAYTYGYYNSGNLTGEFCTYSPSFQCWSVVTADSYGLGSHWTDTSGTILGLGGGSIAQFAATTSETTTVTSQPESSATAIPLDYNTGEMNNLSYKSQSTSCSPACTATSTSGIP